ncbi:MAG: NAD-dependent epimerase/dehydratase family protein [Brevundimonas sp.]|uniref:NAD-dependent epimerase/dehydratase family protein n=1 Tax=Brevundimonas sp. TaxID=1871086 RepID=UPI00391C77DC
MSESGLVDGEGPRGGALLLGGSGFVGSRIASRLLASGRHSFVRIVDLERPASVAGGVEFRQHDVRAPIPTDMGSGVSIIYNLAAVHRTPGHPPHAYYDTNVNGALNCTALADACSIGTVVFTSSISIYGPNETVLTESSTPAPMSDYGRSKLMAEQIHRRWFEATPGRKLVIVRPGVIFGPGEDGNFTQLAKALRQGYFFYPGRQNTVKSSVYVGEVARALDFALDHKDRFVLFNAAYPRNTSIGEIVEAFGRTMGRPLNPPTVPLWMLLAAAKPFELLGSLGIHTRIHGERVMKLVLSTKVSPEWLSENGYRFETDLEQGLALWQAETDGAFR